MADLINTAGNRVSPTYDTLLSATNDFSGQTNITALPLGVSRQCYFSTSFFHLYFLLTHYWVLNVWNRKRKQ